jgi:RNA polymerase sigma factor (sigma-70 family)
MQPTDDSTLLRQFVETQSDDAFAALVTRHINLVYSVALRQVGQPHNAEEIAQAVFIILAKKAAGLRHEQALTSWLFQTTRLAANNFMRGEMRRRHREQEAYMESVLDESAHDVWPKIAPLLDNAVASLREKDRRAILLRFYEGRNLSEVGALLGSSESAAEKRVSRSLEKLRKIFAKRGVDSTASVIAENISVHSVQIAPVALAKTVTAVAMAKGVTASVSTLTLIKGALKVMAWTKAKMAVVAGVGILFVASTTIIVTRTSHLGEPSYDGKSLTEWLEQSKNAIFINASDTQADRRRKDKELQMTYEAVQHIGPRAIPILVGWVANTTNGGGYILAAGCIQRLGPAAKAAVPGLITVLGSTNDLARYAAFNVLQRIGPAANQALPVILDHVQHDPSDSMRSFAVTTLANNGIGKQNPDAVVPVLIECLAPNNKVINRPDTLRALGGLGASAKTAIPAILPYLKDSDPMVRQTARNALLQIDPAAANAK